MSLFSSQNNPDKWKDKYFDLLDENEIHESEQQEKEALLCKTIIRLSLATTGFNKQLDPYLLGIRKQLKNGLKSEQLKVELERFSSALMTLDETVPGDEKADASILFNFLFHHFPEHKTELQKIEAKFENDEYPNAQYLLIAVNDFIDSLQKIEPISECLTIDAIDSNKIIDQIQALLAGTEVPAQFESQAKQLKNNLDNQEPVENVLGETIGLLLKIKNHLQSEQQEMAEFLAKLTEQLSELEIRATGAHSAVSEGNLLDQSVSTQVYELQESSKKATKLEPLKQLINSRLSEIALQIQQQETERQTAQQELEALTSKISDIEHESLLLKNKLDTAQEKARHDPLTGLANRLAYTERLETEFLRWKRYQTPLSLLIWDIDLFKQINDTYGHKAGDKTLVLIAKLLTHYCRETDFVSRFGGEEFTMLLSNTDSEAALIAANKLREVIEKTAFNSGGKKISITISCGITQFTNDDSPESAFTRADKALYEAKNNGRNQCIVH